MAKIADIHARQNGAPMFICDFSPPRGAIYDRIDAANSLDAHCISVAYNPGKSVYAHSALAAHAVKAASGKDVAFTVSGRDMNILAAQSLLLGAALLGLDNVIVVRGDDFSASEAKRAKPVHDHTTTGLIRSISAMNGGAMNGGADFKGRRLSAPTDFCIGAAIDINRPAASEIALTQRKISAGADFLLTQPGFSPEPLLQFNDAYARAYGEPPTVPIFCGIQMVAAGGRAFGAIPQAVHDALNSGVSPADIAARTIDRCIDGGITAFYLMPPIFPGGGRDYDAAQSVLRRFNAS